MGYRTDVPVCETKYQGEAIASTKGGYRTILGSANLPENASREMGYRSDGVAISRDMGPLRLAKGGKVCVAVSKGTILHC